MTLEEVSQASRSFLLCGAIKAYTLHACINASGTRRNFAVALYQVSNWYMGHWRLARRDCTESLRRRHLAHARTRRRTFVLLCMIYELGRASTRSRNVLHDAGERRPARWRCSGLVVVQAAGTRPGNGGVGDPALPVWCTSYPSQIRSAHVLWGPSH